MNKLMIASSPLKTNNILMKKILAILFISSLFACQSEQKTQSTEDTLSHPKDSSNIQVDTLAYQYDSIKVYSKNVIAIDKNTKDSTIATIVYPVFHNQKIDSLIQGNALKSNRPDEPSYKNFKDLASGFIQSFDDFYRESEDNRQAWFKEIKITVLPQRKDYLGLQYFYTDYAGGAHPNSAIIYKNYNASTLQEIKLDELVPQVNQPKLKLIAERIFRKNEKLDPQQPLDKGYFFEKGVFLLNDNFTITNQGLKFLYNSYEIKPYSEGITELLIPFTAIKELLIANPALPVIK
jgi:hypothetical protein